MTKQYPLEEWNFDGDVEISFNSWFHGDYGPYSFRSEAFYGDCGVEDIKTRESLMKKWVYAAFYSGYEAALYGKLEETYDEINQRIEETDELLKEVDEYLEK